MADRGPLVPMSAAGVPMGSAQPYGNPPSASPEQRLAAVADMLPSDLLGMLMRMIQGGSRQPQTPPPQQPMQPQQPMGIPGVSGGMPTMGPPPMPMQMMGPGSVGVRG